MSKRRLALVAAVALAAASLTACGGSNDSSSSSSGSKTLTYWASNQGPSLEADKTILQPELDKFEKQTGIKVNVEVVPWSDLLNRILWHDARGWRTPYPGAKRSLFFPMSRDLGDDEREEKRGRERYR